MQHERPARAVLVAFSGLDGAGKSTQIELLMEDLRQSGGRPRCLWTRGGYTPLLQSAKGLMRRAAGRSLPPPGRSEAHSQAFSRNRTRRLWLILAMLELLWIYGVQLRWWRLTGRSVVCDRYLWDTLIDFRLNFPQETVERWVLWRLLARCTPRPDAAFLLLIPVEESLRRSQLKGEPFPDPPEVLEARLKEYRLIAASGSSFHAIDGTRPREETAAFVRETIAPVCERRTNGAA